MSDQNNISLFDTGSDGNKKLSEDMLMAYLEGKLSPREQHDVEIWLAEEGMDSDAMEGLQALRPEETKQTVNKLKHELRKTIVSKKHKRRPLQTNYNGWIAIAVILLLAVVAYIVIRMAK